MSVATCESCSGTRVLELASPTGSGTETIVCPNHPELFDQHGRARYDADEVYIDPVDLIIEEHQQAVFDLNMSMLIGALAIAVIFVLAVTR